MERFLVWGGSWSWGCLPIKKRLWYIKTRLLGFKEASKEYYVWSGFIILSCYFTIYFNQSLLLIFDMCCFFCIHYVYLGEDNEHEKWRKGHPFANYHSGGNFWYRCCKIEINDYVEGVILLKENDTMENEVSAYKVMPLRVLSRPWRNKFILLQKLWRPKWFPFFLMEFLEGN